MNNNTNITENYSTPFFFGNIIKFLLNPFSFISSDNSSQKNHYSNKKIYNNSINKNNTLSNNSPMAAIKEIEDEKNILNDFHQKYNILNIELYSKEIINFSKEILLN